MTKPKAVQFDLDATLYDRKTAQIDFAGYFHSSFSAVFENLDKHTVISAFQPANRAVDEGHPHGTFRTRDRYSRYFLKSPRLLEDYISSISTLYLGKSASARCMWKYYYSPSY